MQTIRMFDHYSIVSEKEDRSPSKYTESIDLMTMIIVLFSIVFWVVSLQHDAFIFTLAFSIIGFIGLLGGIYISNFTYGCGTTIKLKDNNYDDLTVFKSSYQFTDDPNIDALEIKNIADDFEKRITEIEYKNKKREEEQSRISKECCNKYKSVIERVK